MSSEQSVTHWIRQLEAGDEEAARLLWRRYFDKLVAVARKHLNNAPRRVSDEEDVALSVFRRLCDGATRGRLEDIENRDELWRVLVAMTANRAIDQKRFDAQQKRGGGQVQGDSALTDFARGSGPGGFDQLAAPDPTPEFLTMLADEHQRLMRLLDNETLRQIAQSKLDGFRNEEIAEQLGTTCRSVQRKLRRIREAWAMEVTDPP